MKKGKRKVDKKEESKPKWKKLRIEEEEGKNAKKEKGKFVEDGTNA
ncbi:3678_t:CDS:2 [Gigaspora margarita]|uniref:3678_t:CDS:1 n=1 Tax=Gigaspora margarita TaxID=4874 RepID=A0ABN7U9V3_GIGMA|nr:3678_t:CDS:2 [Gigaspora margarita]